MIYNPHNYQQHSTDHILENRFAGLFLDMGLGKTISTLTAIDELMYNRLEVGKTLVIAPKRVADHTWPEEIAKWAHTRHLTWSKIMGNAKQREAGLKAKADIYLINRENIVWLVGHLGGAWPFDLTVIDELSSFKSSKSQRFKALRVVRPRMKRVVGLTGTPMPNGLLDLWPQMYLLDQGERLGKTITGYREQYFITKLRPSYAEYELRKSDDPILGEDFYEKMIYEKISDICISMKKEDWLELPPRIDQDMPVTLSPEVMSQYEDFEKKMILAIDDETKLNAANAAALTNKLLQFANGAVYTEDKGYYEIHNEKIEALGEMIEAAQGKPVLVFYSFKSDVERIYTHLKSLKPYKLEKSGDIDDWNRGKIPFALGHPDSFGHGLNMQKGGNRMIWFSKTFKLEAYLQAIARLDRQGQTESVFNWGLTATGTMDEDVNASLSRKFNQQEGCMQALKARIRKYKGVEV